MKTILLILMLFQPTYCDGWKEGYVAGWCYKDAYGCIEPEPPICPPPKINQETFKDGYNRGFLKGKKDRD